jgi:hypothetical protein
MQSIKEKIEEFKNLEFGWYFGEGIPTLSNLSNKVDNLYRFLNKKIQKFNIFPGISGEVMFSIPLSKYTIEIIVEINGKFTFICEEENMEFEYKENITFEEVKEEVIKYL